MRRALVVLALLLGALPALALAAPERKKPKELAAVRQATKQYRDVNAAIAAGYMPAPVCDALPGEGAMGFHYANPALIADPALDPLRPEILLYERRRNGKLRLVGVEYFKVDADQNLATATDKPSLFGQAFDGPMLGHVPGMPIHYDLHAWIWKRNPSGVFAMWNPRVRC
jgi:hypothetical protein